MPWEDTSYADKVAKLERLFQETGHGVVSDYLDHSYGATARDADFTMAAMFREVLSGSISPTVRDYLDSKLNALRHLRDKRSPDKYACDLITGWLVEDLVFMVMEADGLEPELSGEDRLREFLRRPTEAPDLTFTLVGKSYLVDIMKDDKGTWSKYRKLHLRDNKYFRLKDANAFLVALDLHDWRFAVLDIPRCQSKHIPSHWPYGSKPAQELNLREVVFTGLCGLRPGLREQLTAAVEARGKRRTPKSRPKSKRSPRKG